MKINRFISTVMLIGLLLIATPRGIIYAENEEDWMPDPHLRQAVREELGIPDAIPMTPADMAELYALVKEYNIKSLRGLEHAINLKFLHIGRSEVSDIIPLAGLKDLRELKLFGNRISDITPLAGLINLEVLELQENQIVDISPLKGLMNLKVLKLEENQIVDISPLSNLTALTYLHIGTNQIVDFTPLLNLTNLESLGILNNPNSEAGQLVSTDPAIIEAFRVTICDFESPTYVRSVKERIESREYPSAFLTHKRGGNSEQYPDTFDQFVRYDFSFMFEPFHPFVFSRTFHSPFGGKVRTTNDQRLLEVHRDAIRENPNMIFIVEIAYFDGRFLNLPDDSPYWFRNKDGSIAIRGDSSDPQAERLVNFTHPDVIEMIIQQTIAIAKCGLYDGIWLDRWHPDFHGELSSLVTPEDELNARLQILQGIRANVRDDFLIMVNSREEIPHFAPYINGIFIEAHEPNPNYTHKDLYHFENIIKWYESNLREPSFTLLWGQVAHKPPRSQRVMRLFTTFSLTHSDGYVSVSSEPHPLRTYYYDFWDANLGRPMGEKAALYNSIDGLGGITYAENEEAWMSDPHLEQAVRERLEIPDEIPLLPKDMAALYGLVMEHDIESLRGLEHAINLRILHIGRSKVSDLTPLAGLENLQVLKLFGNRISDITPLAGLINLEVLELQEFIREFTNGWAVYNGLARHRRLSLQKRSPVRTAVWSINADIR
jgi:hypothetical protein